jgi:microcystin-dependent protein
MAIRFGDGILTNSVQILSSLNTSSRVTISGSNIVNSSITVEKLAAAVQSLLVPAGCVMSFAMSAAPVSWVSCNGTTISRVGSGANLFAAIGTRYGTGNGTTTFNVPNLQGQFIRGLTTNLSTTSRDPLSASRIIGSVQEDAFGSHSHPYLQPGQTGVTSGGIAAASYNTTFTGNTTATGDVETRPVNMALLYCIKL